MGDFWISITEVYTILSRVPIQELQTSMLPSLTYLYESYEFIFFLTRKYCRLPNTCWPAGHMLTTEPQRPEFCECKAVPRNVNVMWRQEFMQTTRHLYVLIWIRAPLQHITISHTCSYYFVKAWMSYPVQQLDYPKFSDLYLRSLRIENRN